MEKTKMTKDKQICLFSIALVILAQASEKILFAATPATEKLTVLLALIYTALTAIVFFLVQKTKEPFFGLLAALFGYKMLPPILSAINEFSLDAAFLYFIVKKAAAVLFVVLTYKFYQMQEKPRAIKAVPLLVIMLAVPFFNEIITAGGNYFMAKTGNMLYVYLLSYACYAASALVIFAVAYLSGRDSFRFAAYFEFAAFGVNAFRQIGKIAYFGVLHEHISKSFYGWLLVYAVLTVLFIVGLKKKNAEA